MLPIKLSSNLILTVLRGEQGIKPFFAIVIVALLWLLLKVALVIFRLLTSIALFSCTDCHLCTGTA